MRFFKKALQNKATPEKLHKKAQHYLKAGKPARALMPAARAVIAAPDQAAYMRSFAEIARPLSPQIADPDLKEALCLALESPYINPQDLAGIWYGALLVEPGLKNMLGLSAIEDYQTFRDQFKKAAPSIDINDPLLIKGLRCLILPHLLLERFLTHLRRSLLEDVLTAHYSEEHITALTAALAQYCFYTGYIFNITQAEEKAVNDLEKKENLTAKELATLACYMPLHQHDDAKTIPARFTDSVPCAASLAPMLKQLITEPLEEQEIKRHIPQLTKIEDPTSCAVQQQYIDFPYPRWNYLETDKNLSRFFDEIENKDIDILIAGCGTGQEAMYYGLRFPHARILAIDLSPVSLAYAIRKRREFNLDHIKFAQADILSLPDVLDQKFDIIISSGVLHHMKNPEAGFRALDTLLKPHGLMRLCLYSALGRHHISKAHKIIAENGYGNTAQEIRRFRQECPEILPPETYQAITKALDFFILPQCRDLLFHIMEHQFDIPKIKTLLHDYNYEFLEFIAGETIMQQFRAQYPDDPEAISLDHWHDFECKNADTFAAMYKFVCRKNV